MEWLPRTREVGWFKTGRDGPAGSYRYATHHLFLRVEQDLNGTGEWTVELHDCNPQETNRRVRRVFHSEAEARTVVTCLYALTRHLGPLRDRITGEAEVGRWELHTYELADSDRWRLASLADRTEES